MPNKSPFSDILPSLIAGSVNGIICIISAMALSALVFIGPLTHYLPQGIGILLLGSLIFVLFSEITASFPTAISLPQDIPIAILALMAATLMSNPVHHMNKEEIFQFIFVTIGLTSVLVGIFFYFLGQFKLGKLVRFIPFPVVGEVSLYLGLKASASVITDVDCKIYFLSKDNFKKLNMEAQGKAVELHTYIVQLLSDRLAKSNATIKVLMR